MKKKNNLLKLIVLAMLIALGVVISPILRVEGMCPMAHFINILCSVLLGPWYSLVCAVLIGIIRMTAMGIPPIALTGAIFGAFLSGVFYRMSKGDILFAVIGEVIGTGIIGAIISYPVMTLFWQKEGLNLLFYVPSFICGTLIGGSVAFSFLKKLSGSGVLKTMQEKLNSKTYESKKGILDDSLSVAAIGVLIYVAVGILNNIFEVKNEYLSIASYVILAIFILIAVIHFFVKRVGRNACKNQTN